MTPVTHAFLPLLLGLRFLPRRADGAPSWVASGAVAFAGVLPDLLCPHLGLEARHAAFSHSLVAWVIFVAILAPASLHPRLRTRRGLLLICAGAYLAHLLCDLVAGGVPLFAPFEPAIRGEAWLPLRSWFVFDGVLLCYVYLVYRWLPLRRRIRRTPPGSEAAAAT